MKAFRAHSYVLYTATSFWAFYFLGGLWSDYYRTWPVWLTLVVVDVLPVVALIFLGKGLLRMFKGGRTNAILYGCFYFTVPFLVYDYIYLRLYLEKDWSYLLDYWHLTFFSVFPLIVFPVLGRNLDTN